MIGEQLLKDLIPKDHPKLVKSLTEDEIAEIKNAFDLFDEAREGCITTKEALIILRGVGDGSAVTSEIISVSESNRSGLIAWNEFIQIVALFISSSIRKKKSSIPEGIYRDTSMPHQVVDFSQNAEHQTYFSIQKSLRLWTSLMPSMFEAPRIDLRKSLPSTISDDQAVELMIALRQQNILFSDFNRSELQLLAEIMSVLTFLPSDPLIEEGEEASFFGMLLSGRLEAQLLNGSTRYLTPGTVVGDRALFIGGLRSADVVATKPSVVAVMSFVDFDYLQVTTPSLALKLMSECTLSLTSRLIGSKISRAKRTQPEDFSEILYRTRQPRLAKQIRLDGVEVTIERRHVRHRARKAHTVSELIANLVDNLVVECEKFREQLQESRHTESVLRKNVTSLAKSIEDSEYRCKLSEDSSIKCIGDLKERLEKQENILKNLRGQCHEYFQDDSENDEETPTASIRPSDQKMSISVEKMIPNSDSRIMETLVEALQCKLVVAKATAAEAIESEELCRKELQKSDKSYQLLMENTQESMKTLQNKIRDYEKSDKIHKKNSRMRAIFLKSVIYISVVKLTRLWKRYSAKTHRVKELEYSVAARAELCKTMKTSKEIQRKAVNNLKHQLASSETRVRKLEEQLRTTTVGANDADARCKKAEENLKRMEIRMENHVEHEEESIQVEIRRGEVWKDRALWLEAENMKLRNQVGSLSHALNIAGSDISVLEESALHSQKQCRSIYDSRVAAVSEIGTLHDDLSDSQVTIGVLTSRLESMQQRLDAYKGLFGPLIGVTEGESNIVKSKSLGVLDPSIGIKHRNIRLGSKRRLSSRRYSNSMSANLRPTDRNNLFVDVNKMNHPGSSRQSLDHGPYARIPSPYKVKNSVLKQYLSSFPKLDKSSRNKSDLAVTNTSKKKKHRGRRISLDLQLATDRHHDI
eukprot:128072_1